jgi:hypothetical protein
LQRECSTYGRDGAARRAGSKPHKPLSLHPSTKQDNRKVRNGRLLNGSNFS